MGLLLLKPEFQTPNEAITDFYIPYGIFSCLIQETHQYRSRTNRARAEAALGTMKKGLVKKRRYRFEKMRRTFNPLQRPLIVKNVQLRRTESEKKIVRITGLCTSDDFSSTAMKPIL